MVSRQSVERARDLRRRLTPPEARLWVRLRREQLRGLKFRRQHPVGSYILDFYCAEAKLAVEVDGQSHDHPDRIEHDDQRTAWLMTQDIRVIRLAAEDVRLSRSRATHWTPKKPSAKSLIPEIQYPNLRP